MNSSSYWKERERGKKCSFFLVVAWTCCERVDAEGGVCAISFFWEGNGKGEDTSCVFRDQWAGGKVRPWGGEASGMLQLVFEPREGESTVVIFLGPGPGRRT